MYVKRAGRTVNYKSYAMERLVTYTVYLVAFATGGMAVTYFYWVFVPIMVESAHRDFIANCRLPEDEFFSDSFTPSDGAKLG